MPVEGDAEKKEAEATEQTPLAGDKEGDAKPPEKMEVEEGANRQSQAKPRFILVTGVVIALAVLAIIITVIVISLADDPYKDSTPRYCARMHELMCNSCMWTGCCA